jgi:hypothetical protein
MTAENINKINLARFQIEVTDLQSGMRREYDRSVNRDLSQQQYQYVFRRNVTMVLRDIYQQVLSSLEQLLLETDSADNQKINRDMELSSKLLQSFDGVIEELIIYALQKHRSSCALSNFPDEHNPSEEYLSEVIEETSRDWSAFTMQINSMLAS